MLKNWDIERFNLIINKLIQDGLVWLDKKSKNNEILYFFPGNLNMFKEKKSKYIDYL